MTIGFAKMISRRALALAATVAASGCAGAPAPQGDAASLNQQGLRATAQGQYAQAEPIFRQALAVREATLGANAPPVAQSLYNLGYLYRLEGRYAVAEPLLRRALAIRETSPGPDDPVFAQNLNELGYLYQLQGRYADAEPLYARALAIEERTRKPDDPAIADVLVDLGFLYRQTGRNAEAEGLYKRSAAIHERAPGPTSAPFAQDLDNLGNLYRDEGRLAEAESLERRALAIRETNLGPDHPDVADSLTDLGDLHRTQRRWPEAEQELRRSLTIRETTLGPDHPYVATRSLGALATLYLAEGRPTDALQASDRAVDVLGRHLAASATLRSGDAGAERRLYRAEFLRNVALLNGSGAADAVAKSFRVAQLASASTAGDAVAGMAARFASGADGLAAAIRELQDLGERWQALDAATVAAASRPPAARDAGVRREFDDVDARLRTSEARIARDFPAYATLTNPAPLPLAAVQGLLAPDEAMLVYLIGETESWVWVARKDRAAFYRLDIGAAALSAEVVALRARLDPWQNPSIRPFPATRAYGLYQRIVAPAAPLIDGATRVLVVPDGALQSLPLGVLVTRPPARDPVAIAEHRDVAWFARDHALTVLPTVASFQALRSFARRSAAPAPFSGIGDPSLAGPSAPARSAQPAGALAGVLAPPLPTRSASLFRDGVVDVQAVKELPPLPETEGELRTIEHVLGASDNDLFLGPRARETLIRGARLDRYRVVEFATHGLMSGDLGLGEPALVLTPPDVATAEDDGLLTASKIATLKLDADWVVLSACNTAASDGTPDAGGLTGLARAFFYAGARSMLVSHWSVNSLATVKLTTGAFAALTADPGIGRAEALRRSMMSMLDPSNPPELSHPLAWAPFVLAGEGGAGR